MQRNYNNYDVTEWSELMNLYIKNAKRYPLIEIDFIPVTQAELDAADVDNSGDISLDDVQRILQYYLEYPTFLYNS